MDRRSPFKKLSLGKIVTKVNEYFEDDDVDMAGEEDQTPSEFYKFGFLHFNSLFGCQVYRNSVSVRSSIEGSTEEELNAKVVIVVGDAPPQSESLSVHRPRFDLQVVCVLQKRGAKTQASAMQFGT